MKSLTFKNTIAAMTIAATIAAPFMAFAEGASTASPDNGTSIARDQVTLKGFCSTLTKKSNQFSKSLDDRIAQVSARRQDHADKLVSNRTALDLKRKEVRDAWDTGHVARFAKLQARAKTDTQKTAVTAFIASVTDAIAARRSAIDSAVADYRTGIDSLNANHTSDVDTMIAALKAAKLAAINKATADCSGGVNPLTAKAAFDASIKAAKDQYKPVTLSADIKAKVNALVAARKTAVDAAQATFKASLKSAQDAIDLAFPKK